MRILAELVLAIVTLFAGTLCWQLRKRRQFLGQAIRDEAFLYRLISQDALVNPAPGLEPYLQKNAVGYFLNVDILLKADQRSQRVPLIFSLALLATVAVASFYLGYSYLVVNGAMFCVLGFVPIYGSTRANAAEHLLTLALILYRWRIENPTECGEWVAKARSLEKLDFAVRTAVGLRGDVQGPMLDEDIPF